MIKVKNVSSLYSSLYAAVQYCKDKLNEKIEIVVPDKLSLFMEKFLFEQLNIPASFNLKVSTLNRFAKKNLDVDKTNQISKIGSILLINRILNENIEKFSVFNSKAYSFSYAENIFRTIGQLKASKITADEMLKFNSQDEQLKNKISDLAIVYEEYEKNKAGLLDASDLFLMSAFNVSSGRENAKILIIGFDDFTAIEYSIIEQLAKCSEVYVFNYSGKSSNKHIYNNEVVDQLRNIAYINELPFEVENLEVKKSELKKFLNENLFAIKNNEFCLNDEFVKIYSARSVGEEIEFVARSIRSEILNVGKFKEFGVAIYNVENYQTQIADIFSKYEINYYLDSEISINKSVIYKFFNSVLRYNLDGYNLSHLIDIINSPFFDIEIDNKQKLINELIKVDFFGKVKDNFSLMDENLEIQDKFIRFMSNLYFDKNMQARDIAEKIKTICVSLDVDNKLAELMDKVDEVSVKILLKKSKDVIFEFLDELVKFNPYVNLESFYDIYSHIPAVLKLNNLPLHLDCVKIVDANNNMEIFDNLFVVNCTQENAPSFKFDCGIILDSEIEKLNFSHKLSPTISHINKLSRLRLFNLMTMFEKSLTITYSKNASEVVKELSNKLCVETEIGKIKIEPVNVAVVENNVALSKWDYISKVAKDKEKIGKIDENIVKNKEILNISDENLKIYDNMNSISATMLENYFKCPFYMFLFNVLKIKPRLDNDILSFDIGNVLHEIMFKYYKNKKQVGDIYDFCKSEVFAFVDKDDRLKLNLNSPILINLIDEAVRVIHGLNYMDENSTFVPLKFEHEFKCEKALKLDNIDIIGKIDRVDASGDMLRVVDYKSGKADANLKELYYGNKLQLFLYSLAIEKEMKKKVVGGFYLPLHNKYSREIENNYSLNGYFVNEDFVIRALDKNVQASERSDIVDMRLTKDFKARSMPTDNEMENLKNYSKRVSENAVEEIKSGFIKPSPLDYSKSCDYCPYSQTCLKTCKSLSARKSGAVKFSSFKEVDNA